jgi:hypothetical protein
MSWAAEELKDINLGDRRLDRRTVGLAQRMAANPRASIAQACAGWAETQAAYRLLAQDDIEWEGILAPHWQSTEARMRAHPVVLCLQDTTELDFNAQGIAGLGPLSYEPTFLRWRLPETGRTSTGAAFRAIYATAPQFHLGAA